MTINIFNQKFSSASCKQINPSSLHFLTIDVRSSKTKAIDFNSIPDYTFGF